MHVRDNEIPLTSCLTICVWCISLVTALQHPQPANNDATLNIKPGNDLKMKTLKTLRVMYNVAYILETILI